LNNNEVRQSSHIVKFNYNYIDKPYILAIPAFADGRQQSITRPTYGNGTAFSVHVAKEERQNSYNQQLRNAALEDYRQPHFIV
jgi:hypothetical protein